MMSNVRGEKHLHDILSNHISIKYSQNNLAHRKVMLHIMSYIISVEVRDRTFHHIHCIGIPVIIHTHQNIKNM